MHKIILSLLFAVMAFASSASEKLVYVLRLDDEIGSSSWRYTREALNNARSLGADILLVHLNTYGGSVVHADSIRTSLLNFDRPVVAYVDNNAASAGALIALSCDTVYMRPGASMGAATVVNATDGTAMPDKYQSYMRAMMRATAEHHGKVAGPDSVMSWRRDPAIAEAMVDTRIVVPGLVDSTRVLTFTTDEAIRWGYADGKAESVGEVLDHLKVDEYSLAEYSPTWTDHLIGFLTNPAVQAVLIMVIIGGIYMELHTSGMGFPSAAALTAAVLYFLPIYITGIASPWIIMLFVAGLVLILLELFVVPGFGVTGIAGIICVCLSIIFGLIENYTFTLSHADVGSVWMSLGIFFSGLVLAIAAIWYLTSSHGPKWVRRHTDLTAELKVSDGFVGVDMSPARYIGSEGAAVTDMRPAGKVMIGDTMLDAVAVAGFIHAGTRVRVIKYENAQIYVREL
ncbi:MAG: nodulation protein NfeD [Duncaniella sp.]|nr:nodulation protein NfeD [Duncaniella sp.]MDE6465906.1 nodulation protein NfeD [Duncaniella sp.]MDE6572186.1 nodulation protein NfeD [Duncaniella sp.]